MSTNGIKTMAHIHSLEGEMDEVTIIAEYFMFGNRVPNSYIVDYKGILCTAIFNCFVGAYYVDDKYGVVTAYERM